MQTYKFQIGQTVLLSSSIGVRGWRMHRQKEIARTRGELEYRVKSANEPHERVVRESKLSDVP